MSRNRLEGWKEISTYLDKGVRTLQRWEHEAELPIHRIKSKGKKERVYAFPDELDAWLRRDQTLRVRSGPLPAGDMPDIPEQSRLPRFMKRLLGKQ